MIQNENIRLLLKKYNENKLAHVFLVETNDKNRALLDIKEIVKYLNCSENKYSEDCTKCNLCHLTESNMLPTLEIIFPDGQNIKKSQMEELKQKFLSMPYLTKYNVYIINDAEKFNASSANTMLKFIEEPEKNILGFLITNNKENVINTIKSRCELIKAMYTVNKKLDSEERKMAISFLQKLEVEKEKSIVYNKELVDEKLEREQFVHLFENILNIYIEALNDDFSIEELMVLKEKSKQELIRRIELVSDILERLNYNVNVNLLLDSFLLRLEEI